MTTFAAITVSEKQLINPAVNHSGIKHRCERDISLVIALTIDSTPLSHLIKFHVFCERHVDCQMQRLRMPPDELVNGLAEIR